MKHYSAERKAAVLQKLSEYCREKGLYSDQVKAWEQACIVGQQTATQQKQTAGAQARADQKFRAPQNALTGSYAPPILIRQTSTRHLAAVRFFCRDPN